MYRSTSLLALLLTVASLALSCNRVNAVQTEVNADSLKAATAQSVAEPAPADSAPAAEEQVAVVAPAEPIVDTAHQLYSYDEMLEDLQQLQKYFPQSISYELLGKTDQGRQLPVVYLGSKEAPKKVLVTAAIHSREYMTAQLAMAMLEFYAREYSTANYNGRTYASLFDEVCFVVMPMVNPDGVMIAQRGSSTCTTAEAKAWVEAEVKKGAKTDQIKSNARGIDLNRNFPYGFGKDPNRVGHKGFDHYNGEKPYSEAETMVMKQMADKYNYECFLNYHTHGNLLYYGCKDDHLKDVNAKALSLAKCIQGTTGYTPRAEVDAAYGSWADEAESRYHKPSVTVEIGSRNPVPISEFNSIFRKNRLAWAVVAHYYLQPAAAAAPKKQ